MRRATRAPPYNLMIQQISIHALLAESDTWARGSRVTYVEFLSTLSLRRATEQSSSYSAYLEISIHALLAESDSRTKTISAEVGDFYPRSPCGERHKISTIRITREGTISIHALLAESDNGSKRQTYHRYEFLSTLSLRRATSQQPLGTTRTT